MPNDILDNLAKGIFSSAVSKTITGPFELWRIQRQNYFIPNATLKDVIKKEGFRHLWKGNFSNLVKGTPQYGLNYMFFQEINKSVENKLLAGAASGCISMSLMYPLDTTRTYISLQTNKNKFDGIFQVLKKTPTKYLYGGLPMSMVGFGAFSGCLFYFQDIIQRKNTYLPFFNGGLASIVALTITYPTDLMRRRMQLQGYDKSVPIYNNNFDCIRKIYKYEGIRGFYRGLHANYVKSFGQWSFYFYILDKMKPR